MSIQPTPTKHCGKSGDPANSLSFLPTSRMRRCISRRRRELGQSIDNQHSARSSTFEVGICAEEQSRRLHGAGIGSGILPRRPNCRGLAGINASLGWRRNPPRPLTPFAEYRLCLRTTCPRAWRRQRATPVLMLLEVGTLDAAAFDPLGFGGYIEGSVRVSRAYLRLTSVTE